MKQLKINDKLWKSAPPYIMEYKVIGVRDYADGKQYELECSTSKEAEAFADNWWAERNSSSGLRNGQTREDTGAIIQYTLDDGEEADLLRYEYPLFYEHYHGDFAEHNTLWGLS